MSGTFTMALEGIFDGVKSAGKGMGEFMTNCMKFGKWG
jgi:hypothetical protein